MNKQNSSSSIQWKVGWGYTGACNMECSFCYSRQARTSPQIEQVKLQQALAFVKEHEGSIHSINWGTGENALDDEWWTLVCEVHAVAPQILQAVTTNGYLGYRSRCDSEAGRTLETCISDVDVSLDHADSARHNELRCHEHAFDWAISTLELCRSMSKPATIVMVGCEETLTEHNIAGIFGLADSYGCSVRINVLRLVPGVGLSPPSYASLKAAMCFIVKQYGVVSLADPLFAALWGLHAVDASGITSMRILPDGRISPSTYLTASPWLVDGIYDDETVLLNDVRRSEPFRLLADAQMPAACDSCPLRNSCRGGAKDRRVLCDGDLSERDPYCPTRHGDDVHWGELGPDAFGPRIGPMIHDGYLPTLIFHPRRQAREMKA